MMPRTSPLGPLTAAVLFLALSCSSCGVHEQDSPFDPANLGNVVIAVSPSGLTPAWTLDGPAGAHRTGTGPMTVGSLAAGSYTVTWGGQAGFEAPQPTTGELLAGATLTMTGQYTALAPGTIQITCNPLELAGPWRLEWNEGASFLTGTGSQVLTGRPAGAYVIHWLSTNGWFSPAPASQAFSLPAGSEIPVTGVWTQMPPGTIQIDPNPDNLNAPWTLTGPSGYQQAGTGDYSLPSMPSGAYSLVWGAVNGWTSPQPALATGTLTTGGTYLFRGDYTQVPPVTIAVNVTPDNTVSAWQLTGPGGFSLTQAGDWSLGGLPAGHYTIIWGSAPSGWYAPTPATVSSDVVAGGARTFTGTYAAIPPTTIIVDISPDTMTAPWQLSGPGGYNLTRSGDWTASGLVAGQYTITWGVAGGEWTSPSPLTSNATVAVGGSHTFSGIYTIPAKIAIFTTSDGVLMNSQARWSGAYGIWAHIVILNPDASGVAYWHAAVSTDGLTTISQIIRVAGTWPVPRPSSVFQLRVIPPLLPNAQGAVHVASIRITHFGEGFSRESPIYLKDWHEPDDSIPMPMYSTGRDPDTLIDLLPYNSSWSSAAFIVIP